MPEKQRCGGTGMVVAKVNMECEVCGHKYTVDIDSLNIADCPNPRCGVDKPEEHRHDPSCTTADGGCVKSCKPEPTPPTKFSPGAKQDSIAEALEGLVTHYRHCEETNPCEECERFYNHLSTVREWVGAQLVITQAVPIRLQVTQHTTADVENEIGKLLKGITSAEKLRIGPADTISVPAEPVLVIIDHVRIQDAEITRLREEVEEHKARYRAREKATDKALK